MGAPLKMKDLEARTGVSREAIHFYFREGLLPEPERPKRNVALYSEEHVVRIRAIKQLQQERSLPLEAIRPILEKFDYSAYSAGDNLARFEIAVHSHVNGDLPARDEPLASVAERTGLTETQLFELDQAGAIGIKDKSTWPALDFRDVGIVEQWAKLLDLGFAEKPGYDAAYLGRFAESVREIANAEVDNFLTAFGDTSSDEAAELAAQGIAITNEIITRMRTQALMRVLNERVATESDQ